MKGFLLTLKSATKVLTTFFFILLCLFGRTQSNITRIEYYIDTDPGFGKATLVSITPSTNIIDKVIAINPMNLDEGVHRFYVRAMNASGAWGFTNSMLFYKPISSGGNAPSAPAAASNISKMEYYIDIDPGFGKGNNVSITSGTDLSNLIIPINPGPLAEGVHTFYVRARNASGAWSFTNALPFFKPIGSGGDAPGAPAAASNINKLEYYIDTDPGFGKGNNIAITPGTDLSNVIIPINPGPLAEGVHTFYVRARNTSGAWSFTNALPFFKPIGSGGDAPGAPTAASNINKLEYYIDTDPGFGKGNNVAITPGTDLSNVIIPINPGPLTEGVHTFYVRARNASGAWSFTNALPFFKPIGSGGDAPGAPSAASNINKLEYYIDIDPGYGKGNNVVITPGTDLSNVIIPINPGPLAEGVHTFYVRAHNTSGAWSFTNALPFFKPIGSRGDAPGAPSSVSNINKLEYYIDIDPGFGKGNNVAITPGTDLSNVIIPINPGPLTEGVHTFYVRARNASGAWSFTNALPFFKPIGSGGEVPGAPAAATNITKLEYYIDIDPGFGKATNIAISPGLDLKDIIVPINPVMISEGVHRFYVRARNGTGAWSMTNSLLFYKPIDSEFGAPAPPSPASNIVRLEYYIDTDPGYGKAKSISIIQGLDIKDVVIGVDISALEKGKHMFYVRALNAKGAWSMMNALEFSNGEVPTTPTIISSISPGSLCSGDTLKINGSNFTTSLDPKLQSVKINAIQGTIVSSTSNLIKAIFNQAIAGKVMVSNSNGIDTSSETVTILSIPTFNSIINQEVCVGGITTAITFTGTGTSYSWTNNNTATGLAASGTGNIAAFLSKNITNFQIASTITVTPLNTKGCKGIPASFNIFVDPIITAAPVISQSAGLLSISTPSGSGINGYQWMKDSVAIPGANSSTYQPLVNGIYSAAFTNICGLGPKSNEIKITITVEPPPTGIAKGIYVDSSATGLHNGTSWANAYTSLLDALVSAKAGDTILVAQGTYYPDQGKNLNDDDRSLSFNIKDGVVVYGGFSSGGGSLSSRNWVGHRTILSGEIQQDELRGNNSYHVITTKNVSGMTTLDGLIITSGYANGTAATQTNGGGWYNDGSGPNAISNPTIRNCSFILNYAGNGAGLFNNGDANGTASPTVINSIFMNNLAGSNGGAVYNLATHGGISNISLTNCLIRNNNAFYGGAMYNNGTQGTCTPKLINCLLYLNLAADGAAISSVGNQGTCVTTIINSIVWANIKFAFANSNATINLSYSLTEATTGYIDKGNNKIGQNPFFVLINSDLHLSDKSPAINAGINSVNAERKDLDGTERILNAVIDMGPYEYKTNSISHDYLETRSSIPTIDLLQNIPNPFSNQTRIGIYVDQDRRGELRLFDLLGRSIKSYDQIWHTGYNEVRMDKSELKQPGVYYYRFESGDFKSVRKMILFE